MNNSGSPGWRARVLWLAMLLGAVGVAGAIDEYSDEREIFRHAWQQAGRGDTGALRRAIAWIPDYPLTPYLRFELYRQTLANVDEATMSEFLDRHADWSFADRLRQQWLDRLAEDGAEAALLRHGEPARAAATRCRLERARLKRDRTDGLADRVRELWLSPVSQPRACDPLFEWWRRQGNPDAEAAWQRFGLAVEAGERGLARYLRRYLVDSDRTLADGWLALAARPGNVARISSDWPDAERTRRLVAWALHRLAAGDWQKARALRDALAARFSFNPREIGPADRRIALFQAVDLDAGAIAAIDALPEKWIDQQMLEWRLRAALANQRWAAALDSISRMSPDHQARERWRYWAARALEALDRPGAGAAMRELADSSDYYGFLAALRSDRPLALCNRELSADGAVQRRLQADPEFARALELKRAGLDWHARWTWRRAAHDFTSVDHEQAALLAASIEWHERAIVALGEAGARNAYPWRFPVVERERVRLAADRHGIEPALVLGLMRAESAMQADARSSAGARGLLQLMPGTASAVAKRHGIAYRGAADLYRPPTNIALGAAHLGELQRRFDGDWTLVAAAYNAGIGNAERWRDERAGLARDIWVETLSFHETRDYIPRVLAFATIYEWKLGEPPGAMAANLLDQPVPKRSFACPAKQG